MSEPVFRRDDFEIVFVSNFYDLPLQGLGRKDGRWVEFVISDDGEEATYLLRPLTALQALRWRGRQRLFEMCVGTHWSYRHGKRDSSFYWRRPEWLHKLLFALYYRRIPYFLRSRP